MRSAVANWERPVSKCQSFPASLSCSLSRTPETKRGPDKMHAYVRGGLNDQKNIAVKYKISGE